jgi:formylglycine-generating enzyme required for sulfatase activity
MKRSITLSIVIVVSVVVTALGIDAADSLRGERGTLFSRLVPQNECPEGMAPLSGGTFNCADIYEVSPSDECPNSVVENPLDTRANRDERLCNAVSQKNKKPWIFVMREDARALCALRGARLPSNSEWYTLALQIRDQKGLCNTESGALSNTGEYEQCTTASGIHDLIGNVWEWTTDDATNGTWRNRTLPDSGYVASVDDAGVAISVDQTPQNSFGRDYVWTLKEGVAGMIRGGFFGSGDDAGIFALHADTLPTTEGAAIGFRCVQ